MKNIPWEIKKGILGIKVLEAQLENCQSICRSANLEIENRLRTIQYQLNVYDSDIDDKYSDAQEHRSSKRQGSREERSPADDTGDLAGSTEREKDKDLDPLAGWSKKAYRKVALITHPDKISFLDSSLKENFKKSYKEASEAYKSRNHVKLMIVSTDLGIEITPPQKEHVSEIESRSLVVKEKIDNLVQSLAWKWSQATENQREEIIMSIVKSRGWDSNRTGGRRSRPGHPGKSLTWLRKEKK